MPQVRTYDSPALLAEAAAVLTLETALQSAHERGRFVLGLSGGTTPAMLYRLLAKEPYSSRMPWASTFVFWGDERWAAPDHPDNNQRMAHETLLSHVPIDPAHVIPIPTTGATPDESAAITERRLRDIFEIDDPWPDLMLLGIGDDGHTASLFPGVDALVEQTRLFTATWAAHLNAWRITATLPLINASRRVVFLAQGQSKAGPVAHALHPQAEAPPLPAALVRPEQGELIWLLDRDAGSGLSGPPPSVR